jgi:hypothetical protein
LPPKIGVAPRPDKSRINAGIKIFRLLAVELAAAG